MEDAQALFRGVAFIPRLRENPDVKRENSTRILQDFQYTDSCDIESFEIKDLLQSSPISKAKYEEIGRKSSSTSRSFESKVRPSIDSYACDRTKEDAQILRDRLGNLHAQIDAAEDFSALEAAVGRTKEALEEEKLDLGSFGDQERAVILENIAALLPTEPVDFDGDKGKFSVISTKKSNITLKPWSQQIALKGKLKGKFYQYMSLYSGPIKNEKLKI